MMEHMFDSGGESSIGGTTDVSAANTILRTAMEIDPATLDGHTLRQTALELINARNPRVIDRARRSIATWST